MCYCVTTSTCPQCKQRSANPRCSCYLRTSSVPPVLSRPPRRVRETGFVFTSIRRWRWRRLRWTGLASERKREDKTCIQKRAINNNRIASDNNDDEERTRGRYERYRERVRERERKRKLRGVALAKKKTHTHTNTRGRADLNWTRLAAT